MQKSLGLGFFIMFFLCINSCNNAQQQSEHTNRLIHESSPYLLQHAHNPVDWYPWGTEAFAKAKKENKPVIISIGYAACHWCHVMEHESFEDDTVANFMNSNFVCIKVDREERPDIDQVYIDAAQMMTGSAGWPLNSIALPDGKPFFAGTYFPKNQWIDLLGKVNELWNNDHDRIVQMAAEVTKGISGNAVFQISEKDEIDHSILEPATRNWLKMFDKEKGGYNRVPKFPMPSDIEPLLTLHKLADNQEALELANLTMSKMANGGIYDQVGGGFARYSTDGYWKVPHFEKMLYDNGQLLSLYSKGYMVSKDPLFKQVVDETIRFMEREVLSDDGGFYASLDADSEGEEGLFYVWTKAELDLALGSDAELVNTYYQVTASGNWEHGKNILIPIENNTKLLAKFDLNPEELQEILEKVKDVLLDRRALKIRPGLDTKVLTSWNALAISGLVDAYKAFSNERYLQLALATGIFLSEKMMKDDFRLDRNFNNAKSSINGFLDDYAFTISAFIDIYKVTFDEAWLNKARSLTQYVLAHFSDGASPYFYYTSDLDPPLITRKIETYDNVIPSANSEMAMNLFLLGNYFYDESFLKKSTMMLNGMSFYFEEHTSGFANWFHLYLLKTHEFYEVAIVGNNYSQMKERMETQFLPNAILMGGAKEGSLQLLQNKLVSGETNIYVCKEKMCKLPVSDVQLALDQMNP